MKKEPVEEIKTDSSRNTIINQHKKFGKTISVNGCFGSSNIGQKAGFIVREIVKRIPNAFMRCPVALFPEVEGPEKKLGPEFDEEKMKEIAEKIIKDIKEKIFKEEV